MLAKNDVMEMTKRGVPGVWTYGFYDGWVPNYMFFIAHSHNAIGRFYEVQSYGPRQLRGQRRRDDQPRVVPVRTRRCRPSSGARATTPTSSSRRCCSRSTTSRRTKRAVSRELLAEEQARGRQGQDRPDLRLGDPGDAARKADAADAVNELRRRGSSSTRDAAFKAGNVDVEAGDYIIRGDQPYRTLADMYFSVQNYSAAEPAAVRRHRLDVPVDAQPRDQAGHRQRRSSTSR